MHQITIKKLIKRIKYLLSVDKKTLDHYVGRVRRLEQLSDSEWVKFRELATKEKEVLS